MNNSLYQITNKFSQILNMAEEGELSEEQFNELMCEIGQELQSKSTGIIGYIRNSESLITSIKEEEKRLKELRQTAEKRIEKFKEYVKINMEKFGEGAKIETPLGTLSVAKNPISVEVIDETKVPEEYKKTKTEVSVDKEKIKKAFKETGEIVDGVKIVTDKKSLKIK